MDKFNIFMCIIESPSIQCGDNVTNCPPLPEMANDTKLWYGHLDFINNASKFITGNFGKFALGGILVMMLWCLGVCKVLHMIITGNLNLEVFLQPLKLVTSIVRVLCQRVVPEARRACWSDFRRTCLCCFAKVFTGVTGEKDSDALGVETGRGWRRPRYCDGMCRGAKLARRQHRKEMRMNKRMGNYKETPWYTKKYTCTCVVR